MQAAIGDAGKQYQTGDTYTQAIADLEWRYHS